MECARNDIRIVANNATSPGMLDILESVHKEISLKGRRWVLGHVRSLSLREIERVAAMGLIITPHTNSAIYKFGSGFERTFGPDRRNEIEPLKDLLDAGVPVSLATDNVPVSLFWPIWESVARRSRTNELVAPNQALTRAQAIRCSTVNGAYLSFDEEKRGTLTPGMFADLAVLSDDPLTVEESKLREITSLMTMVSGHVVYQAEANAAIVPV